MRVLVTGGSGLVGSAAIPALVRDGHRVRLLRHRSPLPAEFEVVQASLGPHPPRAVDLERVLEGVDAVVHAAVQVGGTDAELFAVNVEGTAALARAARAAGVRRFVYLSSASVYAEVPPWRERIEAHPLGSDGPYGRSKLEGERRALAAFGPEGFVALRPVIVYRSGPCRIFVAISRLLDARAPIPHNGAEDTPVDVVHADDLAAAIAAVVRSGQGAYNIAGPHPIGFREILTSIAERLGAEPQWTPVAASRTRFDRTALLAATRPQTLSIARARRELGFEPIRDLREVVGGLDAAQLRG